MSKAKRYADEDGDRIRTGRTANYVQISHWVILADISKAAKSLYVLLHMHVNTKRGDREVWPKQAFLAWALGHKRAQSIESYFDELIQIEAIEREREYFKTKPGYRHIYTVHETPPPGYTGYVALEEAYDVWKALEDEKEETKARTNQRKTVSSAEQGKCSVSPARTNQRKTVGSNQRKTVSSNQRKTVTELDEVQLHEVELKKEVDLPSSDPTSFPPPPTPSNQPAAQIEPQPKIQEGEDGKLRQLQNQHPDAAAFVKQLPTGGKARGKKHHAALIGEIARLIDGGADLAKVRVALVSELDSAGHWFSTMATRAQEFTPQRFRPAAHKAPTKPAESVTQTPAASATPEGLARAKELFQATREAQKAKQEKRIDKSEPANRTNRAPMTSTADDDDPTAIAAIIAASPLAQAV